MLQVQTLSTWYEFDYWTEMTTQWYSTIYYQMIIFLVGFIVSQLFIAVVCFGFENLEDQLNGTYDDLGRTLWFGRLRCEMNRTTKQYELSTTDLTSDLAKKQEADEAEAQVPDSSVEPEVGALILRGNRCVLIRSLVKPPKWLGMRLPSVVRKPAEAAAEKISTSPSESGATASGTCTTAAIDETTGITGAEHEHVQMELESPQQAALRAVEADRFEGAL